VESSESAAGGLPSAILPAVDYNDLESDFTRLDRYSGKLIGQISDLSTAKERLQEELRSRSKEMLLFSQQSEKRCAGCKRAWSIRCGAAEAARRFYSSRRHLKTEN